ncbi:tetratricopeptide repeat protein [Luteolibacter ambystomatis]|uniref:Tetratricopeptide repeat protein n=1 Tax=Luteolibacter ambystomatis TaxID=2824561 RepID=A0A975G6C4_9BACT|nr:Amuc_1098 family type IV pilus outer membrane protein [Luteolibacter ambystomatis]QUE49627.1 tetratricopeptide repeat protein [Luteolibacter ambystomatis]
MQKTPLYRNSRTAVALMAVAAATPAVVSVAYAGDGYGGGGLAQREMIRRQEAVADADRLLLEGREAYAKGDYQQAVDKYRKALDRLPDAPVLADRKDSYTKHYIDGSVALAQYYRKVGKYDEAKQLLNDVLKADVDPENLDAKRELGYLNDPIRTNPALTYEHTQNVEKVRKGLYLGEGAYNLGKFDEAKRHFEDVLRVDPYNSAARRYMEKVAGAKSDYYRAAYDQTRAELLMQVDRAWELSVPAEAPPIPVDQEANRATGTSYITNKLRSIIVPSIAFEDTTVEEAVEYLRRRAYELDNLEVDPAKRGVNFVVRRPNTPNATPGAAAAGDSAGLGINNEPGAARIKALRLTNVPLQVALKYICDQARLRYKVDEYAVTLVPQTETGEDLFTRQFRVPPAFGAMLEGSAGEGAAAAPADPFAASSGATESGNKLTARPPISDLLKKAGVVFPEGSSATLSGSMLLVTNTPTELDKIDQLVEAMGTKTPKQVKITTKFVEISQENTDELGFDWIVSPFGLGAETFLGGGTIGNGMARTNTDFLSPVDGVPIGGVPTATGTNVNNIVTGGLRSGDGAITRNNIDSVLNNPNRTAQSANPAPGILALTGLFDNNQVQMIMRGLSQKKGTDLMTAPSVMARPGQKATIEIIREFIYPTEYEPPELPNSVGTSSISNPLGPGLGSSSVGLFPVTPATPTAFQTRNTGVTLEIEPNIADNDFTIDLRFVPEIVEFEGFINYGSPIQSPSSDALGNPRTVTITENRIEMPVFSSRRVNTSLTIYDGYTVAVGGLMREDVQNVEDKVPILGDIPYIGRLFQSKSENRIKSNLIIFVTAEIIDATGRPIRGPESGKTAATPLASPISTGGDVPGPGVLPAIAPAP